MNNEQKQAYEWAKNQNYSSVAAQHAKTLAGLIDEMQKPMKVIEVHVDEYYCPSCGAENNCNDAIVEDKFCPECGQLLYCEN